SGLTSVPVLLICIFRKKINCRVLGTKISKDCLQRMLWDVAIIGGGVVGCATLNKLTSLGYKCILFERNQHLVSGASCGNSGIVSCGFDSGGPLEEKLIQRAREINTKTFSSLDIPHKYCGAIVVAWSQEQCDKLPELMKEAHSMGANDVTLLTQTQLRALEPNLSHNALAGMLVPSESVGDSWLLPIVLAHQAIRSGSQVSCNSQVHSGRQLEDGTWQLEINDSAPCLAKCVINSAGLYGDEVEQIQGEPKFRIQPVKGEYALFSKDAGQLVKHIIAPVCTDPRVKGVMVIPSGQLVNHIILPVPTDRTKGVLLFPSVYGNLIVGPTAEDVNERSNPTINDDVISNLVSQARDIVPALSQHAPVATYAGLRPATQFRDYQISANSERKWVTVGGIRSTGFSACLAIAEYVAGLLPQIPVAPSRSPPPENTHPVPWWPDGNTLVLDGVKYNVTHPLTSHGRSVAKL
ncbi:unnamed protein product, partial [Owenia fusiformis]